MLPVLALVVAFLSGLVVAAVWYWLVCGRPRRYSTVPAQFAADCRARTRDREVSRLVFPLCFLVLTAIGARLYTGSMVQAGCVALALLPIMLAVAIARTSGAERGSSP